MCTDCVQCLFACIHPSSARSPLVEAVYRSVLLEHLDGFREFSCSIYREYGMLVILMGSST